MWRQPAPIDSAHSRVTAHLGEVIGWMASTCTWWMGVTAEGRRSRSGAEAEVRPTAGAASPAASACGGAGKHICAC